MHTLVHECHCTFSRVAAVVYSVVQCALLTWLATLPVSFLSSPSSSQTHTHTHAQRIGQLIEDQSEGAVYIVTCMDSHVSKHTLHQYSFIHSPLNSFQSLLYSVKCVPKG